MGDIAEMKLDGTLCEGCGVLIGEPVGHARRCLDCKPVRWMPFDCSHPNSCYRNGRCMYVRCSASDTEMRPGR